jgi:hypothetical protein
LKATLLSLVLKNIQLDNDREKRSVDSELLELLLEDEKDEESFVWVVDLTIEVSQQIDKEQMKKDANFFADLFETIDHFDDVEQSLAPLYEHQLGRKYLAHLTDEEQEELVEKAEKMLIQLLY